MENPDRLERLFGELHSREFMFKVEGRTYKLPHLNTMKPKLLEARERFMNANKEIPQYKVMMFLFENSGNPAFFKQVKSMTMKDAFKVYDAWFEWSGFTLPKSSGRGKR